MQLAERVFGTDVPLCKGKWVAKKPPVVRREDHIELPPELNVKGREVDLAVDVVYINKEAFLHGLDRTIKCPNLVVLGTYAKGEAPTSETLGGAIGQIIQKYNQANVTIKTIHADNEFRTTMSGLGEKWQVDFNFCNPKEHVPDNERENRTLEERFRVLLHRLPLKMIPRMMIR